MLLGGAFGGAKGRRQGQRQRQRCEKATWKFAEVASKIYAVRLTEASKRVCDGLDVLFVIEVAVVDSCKRKRVCEEGRNRFRLWE